MINLAGMFGYCSDVPSLRAYAICSKGNMICIIISLCTGIEKWNSRRRKITKTLRDIRM